VYGMQGSGTQSWLSCWTESKRHLSWFLRPVDHGKQFGRQAVKIELLAHTRRERFDRRSVNCSTAAVLAL
jgi:hypothetical protein